MYRNKVSSEMEEKGGSEGQVNLTMEEETGTTGHETMPEETCINPIVMMAEEGSEVDKREEMKRKYKAKKREYIESFTIHGLSRICTGTRTESLFWLSVLIIGISVSLYVIYDQVSKYLKYEVYTTVTNHVNYENTFPSITICDVDLLNREYSYYCGLIPWLVRPDHQLADKPCNYSLSVPYPQQIKNILDNKFGWSNGIFHITFCRTMDGKQCATDDYIQSVRSLNHACFRVNWNGNLHDDTYGNMDLHFKINKSSGVVIPTLRMAIQQHDLEGVDVRRSTLIEPNKKYKADVKNKEIRRLPYPFPSNCVNGKGNDIFPGKYNRMSCLNSIDALDMFKHCGDIFDIARPNIPEELFKTYWRANKTVQEAIHCLRYHKPKKTNEQLCPVPCHETEWETSMAYYGDFKPYPPQTMEYRIEVQLQNVDSYTIIEENQLYTWEQIAGQIGGFIGLVIGASVISIIEIVAYLGLCVINKWNTKT